MPVTVAVYVPGVLELKVQLAPAEPPDVRLTDEGQETVSPEGAEVLRLTGPDRPKRLVRVTVPPAEEPDGNPTVGADILKSAAFTLKLRD